ncbi:MAG: hypothetical protein M5U25_21150 [Planctomycetota bacterium]|nr:hypothetical protein [Planctomycetota bacterium]
MAACTFAERIALDLAVLVASASIIDLSRQRDATATENTARTTRVCQMAAAKVESRLGSAGSYDTVDGTIGEQIWLDFGVRLALLYYSQVYTFTLTEKGMSYVGAVREEIEEYRQTLVQETPRTVIQRMDNEALNKRRPHSTWGSNPDDAVEPEI